MAFNFKQFFTSDSARTFIIRMLVEEIFGLFDKHVTINNKEELISSLQARVNLLPKPAQVDLSSREDVKEKVTALATVLTSKLMEGDEQAKANNSSAVEKGWFDTI